MGAAGAQVLCLKQRPPQGPPRQRELSLVRGWPQAPVPRLNRAIAEEQLGVEAAARGDAAAAERLYSAAVEVGAPLTRVPAGPMRRCLTYGYLGLRDRDRV